jgi:hypothetical protein
MIETISKSPFYIALIIILPLFTIWLIAFGGIRWIWNFYLKKWPFKLKVLIQRNCVGIRQKFFSKKIVIGTISPVFPTKIEFKIIPRRKLIFEQVGFRLEGKRWFWTNEPKDVVYVKGIKDINIENEELQYHKTHIADIHKVKKPKDNIKTLTDIDGGTIGQYPIPEICPKGGSLLLEVELYVKVKEKWKGYITFKHLRGEDCQRSACLPIEFYLVD